MLPKKLLLSAKLYLAFYSITTTSKASLQWFIRCEFSDSDWLYFTHKLHIYAEWEQSSGRVLSLRDDDSQSLIDGEWRRINTLSYYKVMKVPTSVLLFRVHVSALST